jgi:hypothetical protein
MKEENGTPSVFHKISFSCFGLLVLVPILFYQITYFVKGASQPRMNVSREQMQQSTQIYKQRMYYFGYFDFLSIGCCVMLIITFLIRDAFWSFLEQYPEVMFFANTRKKKFRLIVACIVTSMTLLVMVYVVHVIIMNEYFKGLESTTLSNNLSTAKLQIHSTYASACSKVNSAPIFVILVLIILSNSIDMTMVEIFKRTIALNEQYAMQNLINALMSRTPVTKTIRMLHTDATVYNDLDSALPIVSFIAGIIVSAIFGATIGRVYASIWAPFTSYNSVVWNIFNNLDIFIFGLLGSVIFLTSFTMRYSKHIGKIICITSLYISCLYNGSVNILSVLCVSVAYLFITNVFTKSSDTKDNLLDKDYTFYNFYETLVTDNSQSLFPRSLMETCALLVCSTWPMILFSAYNNTDTTEHMVASRMCSIVFSFFACTTSVTLITTVKADLMNSSFSSGTRSRYKAYTYLITIIGCIVYWLWYCFK